MSTDKQKREKLVHFLDQKTFDPILKKSEDDFSSENKKKKFKDVKKSTEAEQKRFHNEYKTAEEVKKNYLSDLNSSTAKRKNNELEDLGLPRLPHFKKEFLDMCQEMGV